MIQQQDQSFLIGYNHNHKMTTVKPRTLLLKEIRRQIRSASVWINTDGQAPNFWSSKNYTRARRVPSAKVTVGDYPYYVRSSKAVEDIAEKILEKVENYCEEKDDN